MPLDRRSWLCPTDADVQRFYECLEAINRSRRQVVTILVGFATVATPWVGLPNLATFVAAAVLGVVAARLARSKVTQIWSGVIISGAFQLLLCTSVTFTGGLQSPYLSWLTVPVTMLAARYRRTVLLVAIGCATLMGALACLLAELLDTPGDYPAFVDGIFVLGLTCALTAIALNLQSSDIESRAAAKTDPLTGLMNRKELDNQFRTMSDEAREHESWISVLICDLDHFKSINDTYGHAAGDDVLRYAATVLARHLRPQDRVFRLGGEEFLALLPHTTPEQSITVGERIRAALEAERIGDVVVTASIGVASALAAADQRRLTEAADEALYQAKAEGRNRVVAAAPLT
jgi:diguanylate cyclase (GGDEF)-like protein